MSLLNEEPIEGEDEEQVEEDQDDDFETKDTGAVHYRQKLPQVDDYEDDEEHDDGEEEEEEFYAPNPKTKSSSQFRDITSKKNNELKKKSSAQEHHFQAANRTDHDAAKTGVDRPKSGVIGNKPKASARPIEEDFNMDDIFMQRSNKVRNTLETIKEAMERLKLTGSPTALKDFHLRCYPYLVAVLASDLKDAYQAALHIIKSTFCHFNACTDAYAFLLEGILGLFEKKAEVPAADQNFGLLHDCLGLLLLFPFKSELFRQLIDKLEATSSPSISLFIKILSNLLSQSDNNEAYKIKKKDFYPLLSRLVHCLSKVPAPHPAGQPRPRRSQEVDRLHSGRPELSPRRR